MTWDTDYLSLDSANGEQSQELSVGCYGNPPIADGNGSDGLFAGEGDEPIFVSIPGVEVDTLELAVGARGEGEREGGGREEGGKRRRREGRVGEEGGEGEKKT